MDLVLYREKAGKFLAERGEELYAYVSGRKDRLEMAGVYERYAESLFSDRTVRRMMEELQRTPPAEQRGRRCLLRFAFEQNLAWKVVEIDEEVAREARVPDDQGDDHSGLELKLANEDDRAARRVLYERLRKRTGSVNHLRLQRLARLREESVRLTGMSYGAFYSSVTGIDTSILKSQIESFLEAGRDYYFSRLARFSELILSLKPREIESWDVDRLFRGKRYDHIFARDRAMSLLKRTLMMMGIDLKKIGSVIIDAQEREGKSLVSRCLAVEVPRRIYLVIRPKGGLLDLLSLFYQAGRALQAAHVGKEQPFEFRALCDKSVWRTFGNLFQYLVLNLEWLEDFLKLTCSEELRSFIRFSKLHALRSHAVRFLAELDYHDGGRVAWEDLVGRLVRLNNEILGLPVDEEFVVFGLEEPFSSAEFLRSWIFEAELREILTARFGKRWYSRPAAGDFLKELWSYGQRFPVEELASKIRLVELNLEPIIREMS